MFSRSETLEISREDSNILRLYASICVILVHVGYTGYYFFPKLDRYVSFGTTSGLALFLVFAGYGLMVSNHKSGLNNYWEKKIKRVFAPAWITQVFHYAFTIIYTFITTRDITTNWQTLFEDILCVPRWNYVDSTMWFLSYLLFCYVSFYLVFLIFHNTLTATIVLSVFWLASAPLQAMIWFCGYFCVGAFIVGVWIGYLTVEKPVKVSKFFKLSILIICVLYIKYFQVNAGREIRMNLYSIASSIILLVAVQFVPRRLIRLIAPFGKYAFPIYLFEYKIIYSWFPYESFSQNIALLFFIALTIITFIVSVAYQKMIEWFYSKHREIIT